MLRILCLLMVLLHPTVASATIFVNETFEGSAPSFGFGNIRSARVDGSCSSPTWGTNTWCLEKSSEGWGGTGAAHIVVRGGSDQYDFGWYENSGWTGGTGDSLFIRFRQKFDSNFRWDGAGSLSNKMVLVGFDEAGSTRMIAFSRQPHPTVSCAGYPSPCNSDGTCGTYAAGIGITTDCAGGLPTEHTYSEWQHVQIELKCGSSGYVKIWVNNNTYASPTDSDLSMTTACGNWGGEYKVGGFQTDAPARDQGWLLDDFQIADAFDSTWYPTASGVGNISTITIGAGGSFY